MLQTVPKRKRSGFTLIEIMIVVLIIGLLIGIAIPGFVRSRDTVRMNTCITHLRHIQDAKDQFTIEHRKKQGDEVKFDDLVPDYLRVIPVCPTGGTYDPKPIGEDPTCTIEDHKLW